MSVQDLLNYLAIQDPSSSFTKSVTEDIDGTVLERLEYIANRAGGVAQVANQGYEVYPAAAAGINPTNAGSAWANGAWSEVVASTAHDDYIIGATFSRDAATFEAEVDIGVGGAGAESAVSTIPMQTATYVAEFVMFFPFPIPVASGSRIAVRVRSSSTTNEPARIRIVYVRQANLG